MNILILDLPDSEMYVLGSYLDQCGHRVHFVQVLGDAFHQVSHRHTNGPGGVALQLDNIIGTAVHKQSEKKLRVRT